MFSPSADSRNRSITTELDLLLVPLWLNNGVLAARFAQSHLMSDTSSDYGFQLRHKYRSERYQRLEMFTKSLSEDRFQYLVSELVGEFAPIRTGVSLSKESA
ncbi:hypothetical protein Tco_0439633 [Tanacetum coccineum]